MYFNIIKVIDYNLMSRFRFSSEFDMLCLAIIIIFFNIFITLANKMMDIYIYLINKFLKYNKTKNFNLTCIKIYVVKHLFILSV